MFISLSVSAQRNFVSSQLVFHSGPTVNFRADIESPAAQSCSFSFQPNATLYFQQAAVYLFHSTANIEYPAKSLEMRLVGLTGGIGTGKSTVSNLFKAHGIPIVDADVVARKALEKGTGGWRKVVAAFGDEILLVTGEVDRAKLGQIVFTDPDKRHLLNRLLAPYISSGIFLEVFRLWLRGCKIIVLDVPLLFEAKIDQWTKPIVVVWADPETQLQRLMARDGSTAEEAKSRIASQMPLDLKRSKADIVIDNSGSLEELNERFGEVLVHVRKPLTWAEFGLSRDGAFVAFVSTLFAVILCRKAL